MGKMDQIHPAVFRFGDASEAAGSQAGHSFPFGLGESGLHEVCESRFGDLAALSGFVLATAQLRSGAIAWIGQRGLSSEHGTLMMAGQASLRRDCRHILSIRTQTLSHALWALEEVICSAAVGAVIAELEQPDFTASRRLLLASERHGVPVILLLPFRAEGATAATARWRVQPEPSSFNRFDPHAPGNARWCAQLERSRMAPDQVGRRFYVELDHETLSLRMVSGMATHAPASRPKRKDKGNSETIRATG